MQTIHQRYRQQTLFYSPSSENDENRRTRLPSFTEKSRSSQRDFGFEKIRKKAKLKKMRNLLKITKHISQFFINKWTLFVSYEPMMERKRKLKKLIVRFVRSKIEYIILYIFNGFDNIF
ncbi:hypothetical protein SNEBB_005361 [Seison nebaliae]|nr:hypothetical protein SNEBB_005361 [Seison nebaliae]